MNALALSKPDYRSGLLIKNYKQGLLIILMKMSMERVIKPGKPG